MTFLKTIGAAMAATVLAGVASANTVVFQDDFNADDLGGGYFHTVTSLTNWDVVAGNVDVLNSGGFCGAETCIDLDGSTSPAAARLETLTTFSFQAGADYTLTLDILTGTQADPFTFGIVGGPSQSETSYMAPFSSTLSFNAGAGFTGKLFIQMDSGPNDLGPYLEQVTLTETATTTPSAIPLPAGGVLTLTGLAAIGALRRRRR